MSIRAFCCTNIYRFQFFLYDAVPPVLHLYFKGNCVTKGGTVSYKKKKKSLYILTKRCPDRHKNFDYWYLLHKYGPDTRNVKSNTTSLLHEWKIYHHAGDSCPPYRYRSVVSNNLFEHIDHCHVALSCLPQNMLKQDTWVLQNEISCIT